MASETFKKRQKEVARREKQLKKVARRLERRNEKATTESQAEETDPTIAESALKQGPTIL